MAKNNPRASSYRRAFGSQTAYSTAGSKQWGNLDPAIQGLLNKKKDPLHRSNPTLNEVGADHSGTASVADDFRPPSPQTGLRDNESNNAHNLNNGVSSVGYGLQLSQPMYPSMIIGKTNEKDQLSNLNSRFQSYISKVRYLEDQNKKLEEKIKERTKRATETRVKAEDVDDIYNMRKQIDDLTVNKANFQVERDNLRGDAMELKQKLEEENTTRNELDDELTRLRKDVDDATMVRTDLERKIETLREELDYNRKVHHEEQKQLKKQIEQQGLQVEVDGITPDISEMLRQIRAQYDQISIKHRDEAEQWYKKKCEDLEVKQKSNVKELEKVSIEINEYRRQVTHLEMELESLRGTNEYLERNLQDVEKRYELDLSNHQNRLNRMQSDLDKATNELKRHIAEYKNLMTIKLTLEKELEGYQTLLDEEDNIEESRKPQLGGPKPVQVSESSSSSSESESLGARNTNKRVIYKSDNKDAKILSQKTEDKKQHTPNIGRSPNPSSSHSAHHRQGSIGRGDNRGSALGSGLGGQTSHSNNRASAHGAHGQHGAHGTSDPARDQVEPRIAVGNVRARTSKFEAVTQSQAMAAAQSNNPRESLTATPTQGNNSSLMGRRKVARPKSSSSSDSTDSSSGSTDSSGSSSDDSSSSD